MNAIVIGSLRNEACMWDLAIKILKDLGFDQVFITDSMKGELINSDGVYFVGSFDNESKNLIQRCYQRGFSFAAAVVLPIVGTHTQAEVDSLCALRIPCVFL